MRDLLTEICVEAGRLLLDSFHLRSRLALREKRDAGWVTEADERSEELILESLGRATPDASVVAEESGMRQGGGELTWYVNPLDGTTNFTRGLDYFSVSIAGAVGGELRHAAVYQPTTGELFYAEQGGGAWLGDDQRLQVGVEPAQHNWVVGTGDLYDRGPRFQRATEQQRLVYERCMVVRTPGSVALSLAHVAAGRLDGFFFDRVNTWDVAAGTLLVREAGGVVLDFSGAPVGLAEGTSLMTGSPAVTAALLELLGGRYPPPSS